MRIGIVTSGRSTSLMNVSNDIAQVLMDRGHDVKIFTFPPTWHRKLVTEFDGYIFVMTFNPIWAVPYFFIARELANNGIPYVFYTTVEGVPKMAYGQEWVTRDLSFVAVSQYVADELGNIGADVKEVIYHGIEPEAYRRPELGKWARAHHGIRDDQKVVLYVGAGYPRKGHRYFAEVARQLVENDEDIVVVVLTDHDGARWYPQHPRIRAIPGFGTMDKEEVIAMYNMADVYVQASLAEGFGLPVLEALASGKPIVHPDYIPLNEITGSLSTKVRVVREQLVDTGDGIRYRYHYYDVKDMVDAILGMLDLASNKEWREDYQAKAYQRVDEHFRMDVLYQRFEQLLST